MNTSTRVVVARGADGRYGEEASSLGFGPGNWPLAVRVATAEYGMVTFGRLPYGGGLDVERDRDGDIVAVHYYGPNGLHLVVWND